MSYLPKALSPLSIVDSLVESYHMIEASIIFWKVMQLPREMFRNDTASLILSKYLQSIPSELPFYLKYLPEVNSNKLGW